jgi:hypothetical protein
MARNGLGEEMGNISHIDEWTAGQLDKAEAYRLRIARKSAELAKAAELHAPFVKS